MFIVDIHCIDFVIRSAHNMLKLVIACASKHERCFKEIFGLEACMTGRTR